MMISSQKIQTNLDTTFIKLIAAIAMMCDHVGKTMLPDIIILQIIGRIAFPIFAYCLVIGALYTHDIKKYVLRLLVFAIISQPFYIMAFNPSFSSFTKAFFNPNIIFTLVIGLLAIIGLEHKNWFLTICMIAVSMLVNIDYGFYGIMIIISFYLFRDNLSMSVFVIGIQLLSPLIQLFYGQNPGIQTYAVLAMPLIYAKTNVNLKTGKYFFYIFYPIHLFLIFLARRITAL